MLVRVNPGVIAPLPLAPSTTLHVQQLPPPFFNIPFIQLIHTVLCFIFSHHLSRSHVFSCVLAGPRCRFPLPAAPPSLHTALRHIHVPSRAPLWLPRQALSAAPSSFCWWHCPVPLQPVFSCVSSFHAFFHPPPLAFFTRTLFNAAYLFFPCFPLVNLGLFLILPPSHLWFLEPTLIPSSPSVNVLHLIPLLTATYNHSVVSEAF